MEYTTYHDLLAEEYQRRKQINSSYSLRAYARDIDISAPRLCQVLSKKQGISVEAAGDIAKKLNLDEEKKQWFCDSVGALHARSVKERNNFEEKVKQYKQEAKAYSELQLEYFKVIADWYHFAILELTYLKDFQNNNLWMAEILGISEEEVSQAIARLTKLNLIREENGRLIDVFDFLATPGDVPSMSLKNFNTQLMKKAMAATYEQDILEREISSNIFSINKKQLPAFKEKLRAFRREFVQDASKASEKDAVYCLGIQLYSLTKEDI